MTGISEFKKAILIPVSKNHPFRRVLPAIIVSVLCFYTGDACKAQGTIKDYQRAVLVKENMEEKVYFAPKSFTWLEKENKFWYLNTTPKGKEFIWVDVQAKKREPAFDQEKLAKSFAAATGTTINPYDLPFSTVGFFPANREMEFIVADRIWRLNLDSYAVRETGKARPVSQLASMRDTINDFSKEPMMSPDKKWLAYIKNYNVYIQSAISKDEYALSFDGSEGEYYSAALVWSPDSKKLATNKVRSNKPHIIYLIESSPTDQLQPKLHSRNYLKPGDALPQKQPSLFIIDTKKQILVDPSLISSQFNVTNPVWRNDSRAFTFEYNQRGHAVYKIMEVNAVTGNVRNLVDEECKTFFEYRGKKYRYDSEDGKEIIWMSERDGWNHLYCYDGETGKLKNQVTKGNWVVRRVIKVDEVAHSIIFEGSGKEAGNDPYLVQYYKVNFDGTGLFPLTTENGNHIAFFSADYKYFVDTYSRIDQPSVTVLRSAEDGKVLMQLEKADISNLLNTGWRSPEVFTSKARDGVTDIWGIIVRPQQFDPKKKYPIIEYIYAGPQNSFVPKNFISEPKGGDYRPWTALHELAELGFIVVQIDGMGTSNRSKAFHDVCWKNLKDAGFPDRILWMKSAAQKYAYMDINRVGIYGNSAGGQNSVAALLFHPEFYKVAVSSSGCHDNRMDKIGWNEEWMSFPVGPQYAESSNVTYAHNLTGQLLLILGELDENVPPESTLQLINALIIANKTFDFLLVPGMGHSLGGDYGEHKRRDFFVKHLLGINPPVWEGQNDFLTVKKE